MGGSRVAGCEEKRVPFDSMPPSSGGIPRPSGLYPPPSRNLGTSAIVHGTPASYPRLVYVPAAPQPTHAPVLRSIDEDIAPVPQPPPMVHSRSAPRGRSLARKSVVMPPIPESPLRPKIVITNNQTLAPPLAPPIVPPEERMPPMPPMPFDSPTEDFIPIIHQRIPERIRTRVPTPPPSPSDDGFTPVTPVTPKARRLRFSRTPLSPREALSKFGRSRERVVEADDLEPLSPSTPAHTAGLPLPIQAKPKRKTLWGLVEGWWDLGLLERGKSLRRRG